MACAARFSGGGLPPAFARSTVASMAAFSPSVKRASQSARWSASVLSLTLPSRVVRESL